MTEWTDNEPGPTCICGNPTIVKADSPHHALLLCLFHTAAEGAAWTLPADRPANWPHGYEPQTPEPPATGEPERVN